MTIVDRLEFPNIRKIEKLMTDLVVEFGNFMPHIKRQEDFNGYKYQEMVNEARKITREFQRLLRKRKILFKTEPDDAYEKYLNMMNDTLKQ